MFHFLQNLNTFLLSSSIFLLINLAAGQDECLPTRCGNSGPVIRFPFWLKDHQPPNCGYPGFELQCINSSRIEFELQYPVTASTTNIILPIKVRALVQDIDYTAETLSVNDVIAKSCFPTKLPTVNSSASPFDTEKSVYPNGYTLFNCSRPGDIGVTVNCLSSQNYHITAIPSFSDISVLPQHSLCLKMYNISNVPESAFTGRNKGYAPDYYLHWYKPFCGHCEAEGNYCRPRINSTGDETECLIPEQPRPRKGASRKLVIAGITSGVLLLAFIIIGFYCITLLMKRKRTSKA